MSSSVIPQSMLAAKAFDYDDVRIVEMAVPSIGPEEALVKIAACGICSGDVTPWYIKKKCPIVLGHEPVGQIVALGSSAKGRFSVGDRVFIHHHAPCYSCRYCQKGSYSMCNTWRSSQLDPGGIAQYVRVAKVNLENDTLILPAKLSYAQAALIEPIACVIKAFRRARFSPSDRVAIVGLGFIGQVMVCLAKHLGAEVVLASDTVPYRLEKAKRFGASQVMNPKLDTDFKGDFAEFVKANTQGLGADLVFVCPSSPAVIAQAIKASCAGGKVLMFMAPQPGVTLTLEPNDLFFREVDLIGSYSCGPDDTRQALSYLSQNVFPCHELITHRFPLEKTLEACRLTAKAQDSLKVLVEVS